uniref:Uncharacterized protein n=1 Tax=Anopheles atroparvus TaxID=41427 RepID=A0A182INN6_ANOAO
MGKSGFTYGRRCGCIGSCLGSGGRCEGRNCRGVGGGHECGGAGLLVDHAAASERKGCGSGRGGGGTHQLPGLQLGGRGCYGGCTGGHSGRAAEQVVLGCVGRAGLEQVQLLSRYDVLIVASKPGNMDLVTMTPETAM